METGLNGRLDIFRDVPRSVVLLLEDVFITGSSSIVFEQTSHAWLIPLSGILLRLIRLSLRTAESLSILSSYLTIICPHYQFTISNDLPLSTN